MFIYRRYLTGAAPDSTHVIAAPVVSPACTVPVRWSAPFAQEPLEHPMRGTSPLSRGSAIRDSETTSASSFSVGSPVTAERSTILLSPMQALTVLSILTATASCWTPHRSLVPSQRSTRSGTVPPQCCICINCLHIDKCKTYRWVEDMHSQPHVADDPQFEPNDPQIQVFIRDEDASRTRTSLDAPDAPQGIDIAQELTIEYDVFACDAFVEDNGRWVRLMPDVGFVPT